MKVVQSVLPGVSTTGLDRKPGSWILRAQRLFFLNAPGGTEKAFVTTAIQRFYKSRGRSALAVASSAVAAQLLDDGRTAHLVFNVHILVRSESTCNINTNSQLAERLKQTALIIWHDPTSHP